MSQQITDVRHMAQAIGLARRGLYTTTPNPRVGCVIVRDGVIIGEGFHEKAGEPHAEVHALRAAGEKARGATLYVTLEPCSHHGRTPPCTDAVIAAGVVRVVAAMRDPNPKVAGQGFSRLRAAGITVDDGVMEGDARELNIGFVSRMTRGRPWVRMKVAATLDGRTALANRKSQWITGEAARADGHAWRARACALLTGFGTVRDDDPQLNVRMVDTPRQPLRVLVDSRLRMPPSARVIGGAGDTLVATAGRDAARERALADAGVTLLHLPAPDGRVDLRALLAHLAVAQCNEVLVEAGATLAGAALRAGLVDELIIYMAPTLMGSAARPLLDLPFASMDEKLGLQISDITAVGSDWRITASVGGA
jgi:diaminohydroxyphosphoribosylaminopyrimidine deaminase/5-amino-6-(5-phosphoribosylamino)uracil reductase